MEKQYLKGHDNLADMVRTHTHVWLKLLTDALTNARTEADIDYYKHEIRALSDIVYACGVEINANH